MRRRRLVAPLVLVITSYACSSSQTNPSVASGAITRGKTAAVIVVHVANGTGTADQEVVRLCARNGLASNGQAVPATITWVADDPSVKLDITWKDPSQSCVHAKPCGTDSVCTQISNVSYRGATPARCDYKIWVNGVPGPDPGVEIENCCP
jgi:hypothetical protein